MLQQESFFLSFICLCKEKFELHSYVPYEEPWNYFKGWFVIIQIIFLVVFVLAACFILWKLFSDRKKFGKWFSNHLKCWALVVLFAGFILYFIGYTQKIEETNCLMILASTIQAGGRALLSSLGMFVFDTDFIEIGEVYHHNIIYLVAFAIVHFLGILISTHFILRLLGERFFSNIRMYHILANKTERDIYIFWGINEESITLAGSIKNKYLKDKNEKGLELIFVQTPSEKELEIKTHSISHFLNSSLHGSSEKDRIEDLGGTVLFPTRRLIDVDKEISESNKNDNHFEKLGLKSLTDLCKKSANVKFFLFSDDQKKNIKDTLIMRDFFETNLESTHDEINLYLRARKNDLNMVLEEQNYLRGKNTIKVHIIDDSNLAVLSLKMKPENHPVQYVSINDKAQVTSEFNALILGFGQTGRDAFRFLYEFGTFPGDKKPSEHEERSSLKITAIDQNMETIKGTFLSKCPALSQAHNKDRMHFMSCDIKSISFWQDFLLSNSQNKTITIKRFNYIIIAMGDDKTNLSLAMDLYRFIMRYKLPNAPKFTIFVRIYEKDALREARLIQEYTKNGIENRIKFFGNPEELYTYDLIINDKVLKEAQTFAYIYNKGAKTLKTWNIENEQEAKKDWENKINSVTMDNILDIKRQVEQDMSNSWHIKTKLHLIKQARIMDEARDSWPGKRGEEQKPGKDGKYISPIKYNVQANEQEIIDNIAICEHLRWNALSELQGYVSYYGEVSEGNYKDHIKKELSCLRPWKTSFTKENPEYTLFGNEALRGTMKYDYNALDTSIYMNKNGM